MEKVKIGNKLFDPALLEEYIMLIRGTIKDLNTYNHRRSEFHRKIFRSVGLDKIKDGDTPFGKEFERIMTEVFSCPRCSVLLGLHYVCPECKKMVEVEGNLRVCSSILEKLQELKDD